jgi:hypothetical protein
MSESKREVDSNGFVEVRDNPISKVGVYPYLGAMIGAPDPNKIYAVLRPAEELSKPETIDSLKLMPLLDDHAMVGDGETPAEKKGIHGVIGEDIHFNGDTLYGNIKIHSAGLLDKIDHQGKKELSAGYRADHEFTPGVFDGETYDAIQRNIIFNHVALVDKGRMGGEVAVLDSEDLPTPIIKEATKKMTHLSKLKDAYTALVQAAEVLKEFAVEEQAEPNEDEDLTGVDVDVKDEDMGEEAEPEVDVEADDEVTDANCDDKKAEVMDQAMVEKIVAKRVSETLNGNSRRDALHEKLKPHIGGVMDSMLHGMSEASLAEYAAKRMELKHLKGQALATVLGFLAGAKKSNVSDAAIASVTTTKQSAKRKDFE